MYYLPFVNIDEIVYFVFGKLSINNNKNQLSVDTLILSDILYQLSDDIAYQPQISLPSTYSRLVKMTLNLTAIANSGWKQSTNIQLVFVPMLDCWIVWTPLRIYCNNSHKIKNVFKNSSQCTYNCIVAYIRALCYSFYLMHEGRNVPVFV